MKAKLLNANWQKIMKYKSFWQYYHGMQVVHFFQPTYDYVYSATVLTSYVCTIVAMEVQM